MIHSIKSKLRVVLVAVRYWPFAVSLGCVVQMRAPLNNYLQGNTRLKPNEKSFMAYLCRNWVEHRGGEDIYAATD